MTPQVQRLFLNNSFMPYGDQVCAALGMLPESPDVSDAELNEARARIGAMTNGPLMETVLEMAQTYCVGLVELEEIAHPLLPSEDLGNHLVRFFIAALFGLSDMNLAKATIVSRHPSEGGD